MFREPSFAQPKKADESALIPKEIPLAPYEKPIDVKALGGAEYTGLIYGDESKETHHCKKVALPEQYTLPEDKAMGRLTNVPTEGESTVDNQPFYRDKNYYVEINGKIKPKAHEFTFTDGAKQILSAEYDKQGRDIEYRNKADGVLQSRSFKAYGPDGRLIKNTFEYYDEKGGEVQRVITFELRGEPGKEVEYRTERTRKPDGSMQETGSDKPYSADFYGKPPEVENFTLTIALAKKSPRGETVNGGGL